MPDQSIFAQKNPEGFEYAVPSTFLEDYFLRVYLPYGRKTIISTEKIKGKN